MTEGDFSGKTVNCTSLQMVPNEERPKNAGESPFRFFIEGIQNQKPSRMIEGTFSRKNGELHGVGNGPI